MTQLFLYLAFVLIATIGGSQYAQADPEKVIDHSISFFEQDESSDRNPLTGDDDPSDYFFAYTEIICCVWQTSDSFPTGAHTSHLSHSTYSARAPPVFLS